MFILWIYGIFIIIYSFKYGNLHDTIRIKDIN